MSDGAVEHTPDGHHVVIDGRRWRATDPGIPDKLRAELVAELMAARRSVRTEGTSARARVQDAKVALGERGEPWWEPGTDEARADRLAAVIRTLLRHRAATSTICPSDAARVVGGQRWRSLVPAARDAAARLRTNGVVIITQRGEAVDPAVARGPLRIGRGRQWDTVA